MNPENQDPSQLQNRSTPASSSAPDPSTLGIHVELFGIPRQRAGVSEVFLKFDREPISLADVIARLAQGFPPLKETCFTSGKINREYILSLNGDQFVREGNTELRLGDRLLLLSADAGG